MVKGSDGTYQYSFSITKVGKITISILLATQGGVLAEYFNGYFVYTGNNVYTRRETISSFSYNWGYGSFYPSGLVDYISAKFYFYLKSPTTGSISYSIVVDDYSTLYIDNNPVVTGN